MSPKPRRLSGKEIIAILRRFGFEVHSQKGSHAKLRRVSPAGERQTLTIPVHDELDVGTAYAVFRQASRYIPANELRSHFFTQ
ncbi:MAG TPA: type II toxin-antitoxin system HicA family toxin [Dehalococcoidia bacterium]|nr:type II toxin-antitoxin system HicA family toxin [Dehalococcoidia bacterium]